jgi:vacuolar-type H+-ATPase subunit I/STV1
VPFKFISICSLRKVIFLIRDDIQKQIRDLKQELQHNKKKKEEEKEEIAERKNEIVEAYKQEQEKYKQLKSQMPTKGNGKLFVLYYMNVVRMKGLTQCRLCQKHECRLRKQQ